MKKYKPGGRNKTPTDEEIEKILQRYREFGFPDAISMVREALKAYHARIDKGRLADSARLYAAEYDSDRELRDLDSDLDGDWPE